MEKDTDKLVEKKWSKKYKKSIDCSNPKGFSQKAHCAGRKKRESKMSLKLEELVGKKLTEEQFDEAAGKKDACYHKVKARYDVWPSAYASGALVKCRKVGAKNWGNKSKKESVNILGVKKLNEGKFRVFFDLDGGTPQTNLGRMSVEVTAKDKKEAEKMVADKFVGGMKLIRKNMTKKLKENVNEAPKIDSKLLNRLKSLNDEIYNLLANYRTVPKIDKVIGAWMKGLHRSIDRLNIKMKESTNEGLNEKRGTCWVGYQQVGMKKKGGKMVPNCVKEIIEVYYEENGKGHGYTLEHTKDLSLTEAEYQGRKVKLGKVMQGDAKKFKVYVKNPKGNVVKVNFGQGGKAKGGTMRIRKSNPKARANFRARHNCDNPGPRHKARYWSCKKW